MKPSSTVADSNPEPGWGERIDALLDEVVAESFPAGDLGAIGSGIAAIKDTDRSSP